VKDEVMIATKERNYEHNYLSGFHTSSLKPCDN